MEEIVWALVPIAAIIGGITYSIVKTTAMARVRELEVRERIAMIEKGLIPPPESNPRGFEHAMAVVDRVEARREREYDDPLYRRGVDRHRSAGITLLGIGFGLMFMLGMVADVRVGLGVGGFLVLLGLAFFVNAAIERRERSRSRAYSTESMPPSSASPSDPVSR
jgi:hypothetical protein